MSINVINRSGATVRLRLETISDRLQQLADMAPPLAVSTDIIAVKTVSSLVDGIKSSEIDAISAGICASMIMEDYEYDALAARITISDLHKNTTGDLLKYCDDLISYTYRGAKISILHPMVVAFIKGHHEVLQQIVDYEKDYDNNYFGAMTLIKSYLLAYKFDDDVKVIKERPQQMYLRVAVGIHLRELDDSGSATDKTVRSVIDTYRLLAGGYYTHATPTLFNAGTINHTLSSCYLVAIDDSLDSIYSRLTDISKISKFSGGVGIHVSQVRAAGSVIASTVGRSEGLVPLLRVYNESTRYVSQGGGKRKGSTAVYLEPWHPDIQSAILSQKQQGAPERLCRDLFLALWVPDIFMVRLKDAVKNRKTVMWSLMCPHECPGLTDVFGADFDALYLDYERRKCYRSQVDIKTLWDLIMATQIENGRPYILYKDHVNRKCNQKNLGVIKSSNLCVAGETPVLTSKGYLPIRLLNGTLVSVWNGSEWSLSPVKKTAINQTLYSVEMSDGSSLRCTAEHKFYVKNASGAFCECPAVELQPGDSCEQAPSFPVIKLTEPLGPSDGDRDHVPFEGNVATRLKWIGEQLDPTSASMRINSDNLERLQRIKLVANTLGTAPFITWSSRGTSLNFSSEDAAALTKLGLAAAARFLTSFGTVTRPRPLRVVAVTRMVGLHDTYCFNEPKRHRGVFNGVFTGQCAEITIYSDAENVGVCNLASVCLPKFVVAADRDSETPPSFDYQRLNSVMQTIVVNMNKVIDSNKHPLEQARHSDALNRPIGIGVQGLSEVFMMMNTPFDSPLAMETNKKIFATMYFAALTSSNKLAQESGAYETFWTSPAAAGELQFDMWNVEPSDGMWDWTALKRDIRDTGLRNSLLLAQMPTAGTSIISGHTESVEVPQSNLYTRSTLSGRFQLVNKHLVRDLKRIGMWTPNIRGKIIANDGSIQAVSEIPEHIRNVYKTIYEYKLSKIIKMDADRGAYICQSSSSNRYLNTPDIGVLTQMHLFAFRSGLKCSSYYVRIRQTNTGKKFLPTEEEGCVSCSA